MKLRVIKRNRDGEIVAIYPDAKTAAEEEGVCISAIRRRISDGVFGGYRWSYDGKTKKISTTLCWRYQKATGRCSWSKKFVPVHGWTAKRRDLKEIYYTRSGERAERAVESYLVLDCPQFLADAR